MNVQPFDKKILNKFGPYTLLTGVLLIVLGTAGILLPGVMSLGTAIFVGWLLLIGGLLWAINTYNHSQKNIMDWLKPALLVIICGETKVDVLATKKAGLVQKLEITEAITKMREAAELGGDAALKDLLKIDIKNVRAKSLISGLADKLETMTLLPEVERPNAAWCALNDYAVERQAMGW